MSRGQLKYIFLACIAIPVIMTAAAISEREWVRPEPEVNWKFIPLDFNIDRDGSVKVPSPGSNRIYDPSQTLAPVLEKLLALRNGACQKVSILHIGDSHVQAGFLTGKIRELFQADFGNAGRGLIVPYKLAGMNEPRDYAILTQNNVSVSKALSYTDTTLRESPTGVIVATADRYPAFKIWTKDPANTVTILHGARTPGLEPEGYLNTSMNCTADNTVYSTRLGLTSLTDSITLKGRRWDRYDSPAFFGFSLENGQPGILYHSLGLNSAAFEHFLNNSSLTLGGASCLDPDIIVISLGTNNCYGSNFRQDQFEAVAGRFLDRMIEHYPGAVLLVTTPMESCKRRGRTYTVNDNVATAARTLAALSVAKGIAYWNTYDATGGEGSNKKWLDAGLMSRDRIHLTEAGYTAQAELFYTAITELYNDYFTDPDDREDSQPVR